ncbi:Abi family protein [Eshraghiella crossota]|uniref:Abi family protein n=1 Tax=Eshraghiella crossota TaxID=45851 RepID=UPI003AB34F3C
MNSLTFFVPVVLFRKNDIFYNSVSFQNIMDIYNFDYELRHIILQYVEIIEVQMKSLFSYEFTRLHGPLGYLNILQKLKFYNFFIFFLCLKRVSLPAAASLPDR